MRKRRRTTKHSSVQKTPIPLTQEGYSTSLSAREYRVRQERIPLPFGVKGEQHEIDLGKHLCSDPSFRDDIKKAQQILGAEYWRRLSKLTAVAQRINKQLLDSYNKVLNAHPNQLVTVRPPRVQLQHESEIERLVKNWALDDLPDVDRWLEELIRFWQPGSDELPYLRMVLLKTLPLDLANSNSLDGTTTFRQQPIFKAITASVEYCAPVGGQGSSRKALRSTMMLRPGVSIREIQQAAKEVLKRLAVNSRRHRPGLTEYDCSLLRIFFQGKKDLLEKPGRHTRIVDQAVRQMKDWGRPIGANRVGNELRKWRSENGYPVRRYMTSRQDSRS